MPLLAPGPLRAAAHGRGGGGAAGKQGGRGFRGERLGRNAALAPIAHASLKPCSTQREDESTQNHVCMHAGPVPTWTPTAYADVNRVNSQMTRPRVHSTACCCGAIPCFHRPRCVRSWHSSRRNSSNSCCGNSRRWLAHARAVAAAAPQSQGACGDRHPPRRRREHQRLRPARASSRGVAASSAEGSPVAVGGLTTGGELIGLAARLGSYTCNTTQHYMHAFASARKNESIYRNSSQDCVCVRYIVWAWFHCRVLPLELPTWPVLQAFFIILSIPARWSQFSTYLS